MKIDSNSRFPHPVLSQDTGDYLGGAFEVDVSVIEKLSASQVTIEYSVTLTEPSLLAAVSDGRAGVGLFVTCPDTYFNDLIALALEPNQFSFEPGSLMGRVAMRPMVWARTNLEDFSLSNCHREFGTGAMHVKAGSVLALDDVLTINIGREKLAQVETIFSIVEAVKLDPDSFALQLDSEKIQILVASNIYQKVNTLRKMTVGGPVVFNSIYLPAVMEVLSNLKDGAGGNEGRRWHRVFTAKCEHLGIKLDGNDLWQNAQKLLRNPFSQINNCVEFAGE
ncbi:hypothetical protein [Polaromonas sp. YR568]|uniref:hypothetical protein n=1 Tax=Polaromonas sp. YR568 TaxID=1855301 RepID=UPI0031379232